MPNRLAVYPGSFDPPTFGHLDLIYRAARIFPRLVVAVATNNEKQCLFTVAERIEMLQAITRDMPTVEIDSFTGLTAEFARKRAAVAIVRGLRAISDFEYEHGMAVTNQKLNPEVDTVCLMPSEPYLFLSSRVVKEVARLGGDVSHAVPPIVLERLRQRFGQGQSTSDSSSG
ncbi:MAG TPA: pantetheine-phosphate adenylyltransferase [Candidatus Hydrogenedentes bacterium]|nr:pantetheine-phosphate adenylyltransferase [Candidatus Hydrogenedentota bacterium]HOT49410.1 pantetheine-phosphate adenylyltransferase [Candidatus Hydrogenedentota bacterium]HOV74421.1 pantetheine-phosphate adenylyltransferase [Candidatus Hydrogenedentota bacterium]HPC16679.1 pantetheine-phosphate adenylyltransferase [Candidatus Hydrogenedentota bacterium]HRT21995.1 pantetheine-phosphate adenylyltransferase [Candidatus Hydrogenedentota bacterium]